MQDKNQKPYFFNPGMTPEQLEEWLNKQMLFVRNYNRLAKEKAHLEIHLRECNKSIGDLTEASFTGINNFPDGPWTLDWDPRPENVED
ncbi:TPA: hypothetical protein U0D20_004826 [Escherichia coli]|nr:hypothetical protein [Escherichia coli]HEM0854093.1 hypothetical protein [Escherichia coli]